MCACALGQAACNCCVLWVARVPVERGRKMRFHVHVELAEDGWFVAQCPALPAFISQGRDEQEALENVREAIVAWLWAEDQKAVAAQPANRPASVLVTV